MRKENEFDESRIGHINVMRVTDGLRQYIGAQITEELLNDLDKKFEIHVKRNRGSWESFRPNQLSQTDVKILKCLAKLEESVPMQVVVTKCGFKTDRGVNSRLSILSGHGLSLVKQIPNKEFRQNPDTLDTTSSGNLYCLNRDNEEILNETTKVVNGEDWAVWDIVRKDTIEGLEPRGRLLRLTRNNTKSSKNRDKLERKKRRYNKSNKR